MKKKLLLLVISFLFSFLGYSQDFLKSSDLSVFKAESLTQSDIAKIDSQIKAQGTSIDQLKPIALSKGMDATEFEKLRTKLATIATYSKKSNATEEVVDKAKEKITNRKVKDTLNNSIFGSELFDNPTLNFEPNLQLATPVNYVLGPGDELQISVYGVQEYNGTSQVSNEGLIDIQNVGQISVAGMTIEAATNKITAAIARIYSTVASGQSQVGISLGRIRSIRITVIGGKQPGNYTVSSLATVYNALHLAGGPGANGSYRNIQLIRNNKVIRYVDIYHFLVNGDQSDNLGLKDNDVIRIPAYDNRVVIEGEVKRPGVFELKKGESFKDLVSFTSGFNDFAYTSSVQVIQKTAKEFKVTDIKSTDFATYKPQSGDVFKVGKLLNRFENKIKINGAVFRPSTYSFYEGMRVTDLIKKAEGLKEDAYVKRARIIRLKPDLTTEIVQVDLAKALEGMVSANIVLQKEDIVTVYSILDFVEEFKVTIDGEIKNPGEYDYYDNLSLNDILLQAGGLTGSASKRVEVARMIKAEEIDDANPNKAELFSLVISPENNEQIKNFTLAPYDVISIRKMGVYERPESVTVGGAVTYPGKYVLATKKEKIYDVINRAGGLTSLANIDGVKIKRPIKQAQVEDLKSVNFNITNRDKDTINSKVIDKLVNDVKVLTIPIDWESVLKKQNGLANVTLEAGDQIFIEKFSEGVKMSGNVLLTSEIPYIKGKSMKYYLNSAGGLDAKGWKRKAYVIYPNGRADVASHFLFFNSFPTVTPGSQIVVPEKPVNKKITTAEIVSIGSIFVSITGIISTFLLLR